MDRLDIVEYNGKTIIMYKAPFQKNWPSLRKKHFMPAQPMPKMPSFEGMDHNTKLPHTNDNEYWTITHSYCRVFYIDKDFLPEVAI